MKTTIKLLIEIEQRTKLGLNISGKFDVNNLLFSEYNSLLNSEDIIMDVKKCLRLLKGFSMLTIRLTEGEEYSSYPKEINSVRFTNNYGEIKMAHAVNGEAYYQNWDAAKVNHIYENIRELTRNANSRQAQKIADRVTELSNK